MSCHGKTRNSQKNDANFLKSVQILSTLTQAHRLRNIADLHLPDTELGQAYSTLKSLFDQTKKIYTKGPSFLSPDKLNLHDAKHRETIRITNAAIFASALFGQKAFDWWSLEEHFLNAFIIGNRPITREAGELSIAFKTQLFLSAASQEDPDKEGTLARLFPNDVDSLLSRNGSTLPLSLSEIGFVTAIEQRRQYLMDEPFTPEAICKCLL